MIKNVDIARVMGDIQIGPETGYITEGSFPGLTTAYSGVA
jgi:hypothetical protein